MKPKTPLILVTIIAGFCNVLIPVDSQASGRSGTKVRTSLVTKLGISIPNRKKLACALLPKANTPVLVVILKSNKRSSLVLKVNAYLKQLRMAAKSERRARKTRKWLSRNIRTLRERCAVSELVPDSPADLIFKAATSNSISLSWTDRSDQETSFVIERRLNPKAHFQSIGSTAANTVNYTDSSAAPDTTYYYRVKAQNAAGLSAGSNEVKATTLPVVLGNTIFVDNAATMTGNCTGSTYSVANRNCSGTQGSGFRTILEAASAVQPGDLVLVRAGEYHDLNIAPAVSGTADRPIYFRAYPGEQVSLKGPWTPQTGTSSYGIIFGNLEYLVFDGFEISNYNSAVYLNPSAANFTLRNLVIHDCVRGISIRGASHDFTIENVEAFRISDPLSHGDEGHGGIELREVSNVMVRNVYSHDNDDGATIDDGGGDADGFHLEPGTNVTFMDCTAAHNMEDGFDLTGKDVQVINSGSFGNRFTGFKLFKRDDCAGVADATYEFINVQSYANHEVGVKAGAGTNLSAYNSVFFNNGEEGVILNRNSCGTGQAVLYNNILSHNGYYDPNDDSYHYPSISVGTGWNVTSDYNAYYSNDDHDVAFQGEGSHSLKGVDPKLFAPDSGDFHLEAGSPVKNIGKDLSTIFVYDYDGNIRPTESGWEIGPYEWSAASNNRGPDFTYTGALAFEVNENQNLLVHFDAADPDGDDLRYLILGGDTLPEMEISQSGDFSFTPSFERGDKTYNIALGVTDEYYFWPPAQLNISITVHNVNRPPEYKGLSEYIAIAGRYFRVKLPLQDPDNDPLTSSLSGLLGNAAYDPETQVLTWVPSAAEVGNHALALHFTDSMAPVDNPVSIKVIPSALYQEPSNAADIFYVDGATGDDNNTGYTTDSAWKTVQKAADTLSAGQMAFLRGGTYLGCGNCKVHVSLTRSGAENQPIIFKNYPSETVIFDGSAGDAGNEAFNFAGGVSNIVIDGLTLNNFGQTIYLRGDNENIVLTNLSIPVNRNYGVIGSGNNVRIENATIGASADRGLAIGGTNIFVDHVSIDHAVDRAISLGIGQGGNANISNSEFSYSNTGLITVADVNILHCRVHNNTAGIDTREAEPFIANTEIYNNTSVGLDIWYKAQLVNSLVTANGYGIEFPHSPLAATIYNSIVRGNTTELHPNPSVQITEDYNIWGSGFTMQGAHSFQADPLFVDPANFDYRLQNASPAIDMGIIVAGYHCAQSDEQDPGQQNCVHWSGTAPDIGANESGTG